MDGIWKMADDRNGTIDVAKLLTVDSKVSPTKKKLAANKTKPTTSPKLKSKPSKSTFTTKRIDLEHGRMILSK